ncbi:T9SS type B sorting domain-containing protein [Tenacibaculum sp. M341]|uniref:T9SS type B sorting domain-containing protein n=1 Tax=Tenacibaculum sp. M341 TaxID=2530339 RepID=UPI0010437D66|nr:T9SS type B sorting domain-containing protein [Tenacibaculum sp. M341]TCI85251.1 T9SS type B sorting domain-containing protein [Tenacibaculum sp. M341]
MDKKLFVVIAAFFLSFSAVYAQDQLPLEEIRKHALEETSAIRASKVSEVEFKQVLPGTDGITLKGNMTFIANSITNRRIGTDVTTANIPFNNAGNNNSYNIEYIDIDDDLGLSGNGSTFSSSGSKLTLPGCSEVVWAGLYWAGIYPRVNATSGVIPTDPVDEIKFRLPGQDYKDIKGDIIARTDIVNRRPYACFKEMTNEVKALSNPNGDYYAANIKATVGGACCGGTAAGWTMVVIYRNQTESSKHFSVFNGFSSIQRGDAPVTIEYKGFKTVPVGPDPANPAPVRANMIVSTLEGDLNLERDRFEIEDTAGVFQPQSNSLNPATNFFNSSITLNNAPLTDRFPASSNTLGFDADLFEISNIDNKVIDNNQTSAKIRFVTDSDSYWTFLNALAIEVIEPDIQLVKSIDDGIKGNDISGTPVGLGSDLWYNVSFQNKGTDDAINTIITDKLPKNVDLIPGDVTLPTGVTLLSYAPPTAPEFRGELKFSVDNSLVKEGGALHDIRFHVRVVSDCSQLRDVCSNVIENQAFAAYKGLRGGITIDNAPSVSGIDACDFGIAGSSNFLIDTSGCAFETDIEFCGASVELAAGLGFASYTWKDSTGAVIGNTQKITVSSTGRYTVEKTNPPGVFAACVAADEVFNVIPVGAGVNPLIPFEDSHEICSSDGVTRTSEIFLCGSGDSIDIATGVSAPTVVRWQQLKASCVPDPLSDCPIFNDSCWEDVAVSPNATTRPFSDEGRYRLLLETPSSGGGICPKTYYFRILKPSISPTFSKKDIVCNTPGNITVNGVPVDYQYAYVVAGSPTPGASSYTTSNVFNTGIIANNYDVYVKNDATGCVFGPQKISISKIDLDVDVKLTDPNCFDDKGKIRLEVTTSLPSTTLYKYEIFEGTSVVATATTTDRSVEFDVASSNTYTASVTTTDCSFTSPNITFTIPDELKFTATAIKDIDCTDAQIKLVASGGTVGGTGYRYAVWTYTPAATATAPVVLSTDPKTYFLNTDFTVSAGAEGVYEFVVVDNNNCRKISNPVTVNLEEPLRFDAVVTNPTCSGGKDGSITVNAITPPDLSGYTLEYSINGGAFGPSNIFSGLEEIAGGYTIDIRATKGGFSCSYSIKDIKVTSPDPLNGGNASTTNPTCNTTGGTNLGSIIFTAPTSGGTGVYEYFYKTAGSTTPFIMLPAGTLQVELSSGDYDVKIEDTNNCLGFTDTVTIDPLPTTPVLTPLVDYNCDGSGNISVGTAPTGIYTYELSNATGVVATNNSGNFSNQPVGRYTIEVAYGSSCTTDVSVEVLANKEFVASANGSILSCNGGSDGSVEIIATNFGTSFDYNINGTGWVIGNATTNTTSPLTVTPTGVGSLGFGNHTIQIRPTGATITSCIITKTFSVTQPEVVVVEKVEQTKLVTCVPNTGATLVPSAKGGNGPVYSFELFNSTGGSLGTTTTEFTNVPADTYTIVATDGSTVCTSVPFPVTVIDKDDVDFTAEPECFDGADGVINVNVLDGNGNYQFRLDTNPWQSPATGTPNDFTFTGLAANVNYNITVKDQKGCEKTIPVTINPELTATADHKDVNCNTTSGEISITPNGGSGTGYEFSVVTDGSPAGTFSTTNPVTTGLPVGTYDVYVRDDKNCQYIIQDVIIGTVTDPSMVVTGSDPTCFGGTGTVTVKLSDGAIPYTVNITNPSGTVNQTQSTNTDEVNFFALPLNETYTVRLTDVNGCPNPAITRTITLVELPEIDAAISSLLPTDCKPYVGNEDDFGFKYDLPAALSSLSLPYVVQVRDEAGTWFDDDSVNEFTRIPPETTLSPAVRIINRDPVTGVETEVCIKVLDDFKTSFNLNSLVRFISFDGTRCENGMTVRVGGSGGSGNYGFAIDAVPATVAGWTVTGFDFIDYLNLIPGSTHIFYVRDMVSGCIEQQEGTFNPTIATDNIPITPTVISDSCGTADGEIEFLVDNSSANVTGGTASWYIYDATKPLTTPLATGAEESGLVPTSTTFTITSSVALSAGTYYLILEEPGGTPTCRWSSEDVEIKDGTPIEADLKKVRDITCTVDGVISIDNIRGGIAGYSFVSNVYETGDITNVVPTADYSLTGNVVTLPYSAVPVGVTSLTVDVTITDSKSCNETFSQVISVSTLPVLTATPNSCGANKTIEVSATGGKAPYQYSVNGGTFSASTSTAFLIEGLLPDSYNVTVKDANGCTDTITGVVIQNTLDFELKLTQLIDCVSPLASEASFDINIISGSGSYEYEISRDNSGTPVVVVPRTAFASPFTTSIPDTYTVTIYDLAETPNCSVTKTIEVPAPVFPNFTAIGVDAVCDGNDNGTIKITPLSGVDPVVYTATNIAGTVSGTWVAATSSITGLEAGTYTVTAVGANSCTFVLPTTVTINDFDPIRVPNIAANGFTCNTGTNFANDATITFNSNLITGGSGAYTIDLYKVDPSGDIKITSGVSVVSGVYTYTISDESGGSYYVRVVDSKGCGGDLNVSNTEVIAPYEKLTNISATLNEAISCVNGGEVIDITFTSTVPITGATVTISNSTGAVQNITGANSGAVLNSNRLAPGLYTISVVHPVTGCQLDTSYEVKDLIDHLINIKQTAPVVCVGSDTAEVSIVFDASTPYAGAYTYTVHNAVSGLPVTPAITGNGVSGNTPLTIGGLSAGEYFVQVVMTDLPECTRRTSDIKIDEPTNALDFTLDTNLISCVRNDSGEIKINATGGWGGYEYMLVNNTTSTTVQSFNGNSVIRGLTAGNYTVTVKDVNGCEDTDTFTLSDPAAFVATPVILSTILCEGDETASVRLDVTAGGQGTSPVYYYTIREDIAGSFESARQSSNTFSNLGAGNYIITVYDEYSCFETYDVVIIEPTETKATATINSGITCTSPNANIEITGAGGTGPYEYLYSADGGATLVTLTLNTFAVPAGNYQVYVRDTESCLSDPFLITVEPLEPLVVDLDTSLGIITCTGNANAVLSANVSGGLGNYSFELLDSAGATVQGPQADNTFSNIAPGTYSIKVTSLDCEETTTSFVVVDPPLLEATAVIENITCNGANDGSVTINTVGGTGNYTYEIDLQPGRFQTENQFFNLPPGDYVVTVQDERGCNDTVDVKIIEPALLEASIDMSSVQEQLCIDDPAPSFKVDVIGGTAPYTLELSDGTVITLGISETSYTFTGLNAGQSYVVKVSDSQRCEAPELLRISFDEAADLQFTHEVTYDCNENAIITGTVADRYKDQVIYTLSGPESGTNDTGIFNVSSVGFYSLEVELIKASGDPGCIQVINDIEVEDIQPLQFTVDDSQINTLIVNATGGIPPYEYSIDGSAFTSNNEFIISETRDYVIVVRDDRGCKETLTVPGEFITIEVPNLFTPNGDGQQDFWYPIDVQPYHNLKVYIYDRYGRFLTEFRGVQQGWDGTYQQRPLPSGDYWYRLEFEEITGERKEQMGHFTLYRY